MNHKSLILLSILYTKNRKKKINQEEKYLAFDLEVDMGRLVGLLVLILRRRTGARHLRPPPPPKVLVRVCLAWGR